MNDNELKALHDKHFDAGLQKAKATPYFAQQSHDVQALRVANEVCDLVYWEIGTYGKDERQRKAMDRYVQDKAMEVLP